MNQPNNNNNNNNNGPQAQQPNVVVLQVPLDPDGQPNIAVAFGVHQRMGGLYRIMDPATMQLDDVETQRALAIKAAVERDPRLSPLSDFEYAQYALTEPDLPLVPELVDKVHLLQQVKQEYHITDTIEDGVEAFETYTRQFPGTYLSIEYLPAQGNLMFVHDWSAFYPNPQLAGPQAHQIYSKGDYYKHRASSPTFQSIRVGMFAVVECHGVTSDNVSFSFHERIFHEFLATGLPKYEKVMFLNTPSIINICHGLWRRYTSQNMKQAFQLGYQLPGFEGRSMADLFKMPTPEIARQRFLRSLEFFLMVRDRNQKAFRLPSQPPHG